MLRPFVTARQACKTLAISRRKVGDLLVGSEFPNAFRLESGHWRIPESDIVAWIERRKAATNTKER